MKRTAFLTLLLATLSMAANSNTASTAPMPIPPTTTMPAPPAIPPNTPAPDWERIIRYNMQETADRAIKTHPHTLNLTNLPSGQTPLHFATSRGCNGLVRQLVEGNAKLDIADDAGRLPIHLAALHASDIGICLGLLIDAGSPLDHVDKSNGTPVDYAAICGNTTCMKMLIEAGAKQDGLSLLRCPKGPIALQGAISVGNNAHIRRCLQLTNQESIIDQAFFNFNPRIHIPTELIKIINGYISIRIGCKPTLTHFGGWLTANEKWQLRLEAEKECNSHQLQTLRQFFLPINRAFMPLTMLMHEYLGMKYRPKDPVPPLICGGNDSDSTTANSAQTASTAQ